MRKMGRDTQIFLELTRLGHQLLHSLDHAITVTLDHLAVRLGQAAKMRSVYYQFAARFDDTAQLVTRSGRRIDNIRSSSSLPVRDERRDDRALRLWRDRE